MDDFTKKSMEKFDKSTVRAAEKLVDSSSELKRIRSIKDGLTPREITTGANDQQYKDGYDKIEWGKNKSKPSFKIRVNGKVINDEEE